LDWTKVWLKKGRWENTRRLNLKTTVPGITIWRFPTKRRSKGWGWSFQP